MSTASAAEGGFRELFGPTLPPRHNRPEIHGLSGLEGSLCPFCSTLRRARSARSQRLCFLPTGLWGHRFYGGKVSDLSFDTTQIPTTRVFWLCSLVAGSAGSGISVSGLTATATSTAFDPGGELSRKIR